jgi:hypothetical protein
MIENPVNEEQKKLDAALDEIAAVAKKHEMGHLIFLTGKDNGGMAHNKFGDDDLLNFVDAMFDDPNIGRVLRAYISSKIGGKPIQRQAIPKELQIILGNSLEELIKSLKAA